MPYIEDIDDYFFKESRKTAIFITFMQNFKF